MEVLTRVTDDGQLLPPKPPSAREGAAMGADRGVAGSASAMEKMDALGMQLREVAERFQSFEKVLQRVESHQYKSLHRFPGDPVSSSAVGANNSIGRSLMGLSGGSLALPSDRGVGLYGGGSGSDESQTSQGGGEARNYGMQVYNCGCEGRGLSSDAALGPMSFPVLGVRTDKQLTHESDTQGVHFQHSPSELSSASSASGCSDRKRHGDGIETDAGLIFRPDELEAFMAAYSARGAYFANAPEVKESVERVNKWFKSAIVWPNPEAPTKPVPEWDRLDGWDGMNMGHDPSMASTAFSVGFSSSSACSTPGTALDSGSHRSRRHGTATSSPTMLPGRFRSDVTYGGDSNRGTPSSIFSGRGALGSGASLVQFTTTTRSLPSTPGQELQFEDPSKVAPALSRLGAGTMFSNW